MIFANTVNRKNLLTTHFMNVKSPLCYGMKYKDGLREWGLAAIILKYETLFWVNLGRNTN